MATDVAARGLDIRALPYVVNYDFPGRLETYIHRVGRTGRLAAHGHSYSFFTRNMVGAGKTAHQLHHTRCSTCASMGMSRVSHAVRKRTTRIWLSFGRVIGNVSMYCVELHVAALSAWVRSG